MKILIINSADIKGGAAKVGYDLARGLRDRGHEIVYLVGKKFANDDFIEEIPKLNSKSPKDLSQRIIHRLGINNLGLASNFPFQLGQSFLRQFDLIHLHDLPKFNLLGLPWMTKLRPTVWTIHQLSAFTGNCIYPYKCDRWQKNCGQCPQFRKWPLIWLHRDASRFNLFAKRWAYYFSHLQIIGVSDWVSQQAKQSVMGQFPVKTILNPVNTEIYRPLGQKAKIRARLGIPEEANVILFSVSGNIADNRKGFDLILEALPKLKTPNLHLIPLGITSFGSEIEVKLARYPHLKFQSVSDPQRLNQLLNAADLLWHPTRADTSSLMILESFAAGLPVVAASIGGVKEIVVSNRTGYLIPANNSDSLAETTDQFFAISPQQQGQMSKAARHRVETQFSLKQFLDSHESLYREVISY